MPIACLKNLFFVEGIDIIVVFLYRFFITLLYNSNIKYT